VYKVAYASLPYQATVRGPSSQSPLTRPQLKFMTDKEILMNFCGRMRTMLEFRGNPEHGHIRSGDGRGYGMTRRKLCHQFRVNHRWINYQDKKEIKIF